MSGRGIVAVATRRSFFQDLYCRWRDSMLRSRFAAVSGDDESRNDQTVTVRQLERRLGRETPEMEILKESLEKSRTMNVCSRNGY